MSGLGIVIGRAPPCGAFRIWQMRCPSSSAPPHGRPVAAPAIGRLSWRPLSLQRPHGAAGRIKAVSVSFRCYPSLTAAFLARRGIDFAAGLHWLRYRGKSCAVACRTFKLRQLCRWLFRRRLFHCNLSNKTVGRNIFDRRLCDGGSGKCPV